MKSPQQRAESAAIALRREGFFQPHPALDSEAASLILRETGLEGLVECVGLLEEINACNTGMKLPQGEFVLIPINLAREIKQHLKSLSKLTPPEA